jgi:hypothetical protein
VYGRRRRKKEWELFLFLYRNSMLMLMTKWFVREKERMKKIYLKKVRCAMKQRQLMTDRLGTVNLQFSHRY